MNKIHNIPDAQVIRIPHFCRMKLHIGQIIQQRVKQAKITITGFADLINRDRSNIYDIYNRETMDTGLLMTISKALNIDFFKLYSDELKRQSNKLEEPSANYVQEEPKRRVMIEVSLSEKEYQELLKKKLL